ncbi:sodium/glucose cotransporter 1-like [Monodelphis domestica]|uniref:sodium/glucose cotransporter 1-like n=1 Tax=Monodelphis domestica TaxID=13616 RepID=UPI0024E1E228|nr:sodium/glucose cotransporter 1-like [Monodelphis domestica]
MQLYRLCWSLRNSKEERIDLDADEEKDFSDSSEEKLEIEHEGLFWKAFDIFYGLDQQKETKMSKEEEAHYKIRITDTSEDPIWGTIVNVNGIILLSVAIVVHVYFA